MMNSIVLLQGRLNQKAAAVGRVRSDSCGKHGRRVADKAQARGKPQGKALGKGKRNEAAGQGAR